MQEKDDVCMVIADMSYGQFPKCVLQQISDVSYILSTEIWRE